jgi:hypothetical protein
MAIPEGDNDSTGIQGIPERKQALFRRKESGDAGNPIRTDRAEDIISLFPQGGLDERTKPGQLPADMLNPEFEQEFQGGMEADDAQDTEIPRLVPHCTVPEKGE